MSQQENLEKLIREIVQDEKLENAEINFKFATKPGDGYLGIMKGAEIKSKNKELSLILKTAPTSEKLRKNSPIRETFLNEIYFYKSLWPKFRDFQDEFAVANKFNSVPKCFITDDTLDNEVLVLEDLVKQNFQLHDRTRKFNEKHMEFVLREYAKFHGLSYAMKTHSLKTFEKLTSKFHDMFELFCEGTKFLEVLKKIAVRLVDVFDADTEGFYREKYEKFAGKLEEHMWDCIKAKDCAVVLHGDCWCNNMMFKFNNTISPDCPVEMRLLDFQVVRTSSPVLDLTYCFYTSGSPTAIEDYQRYLKIYHDSLSDYLKQFNVDVDDHLTFETFQRHWQKFAKYGLMLGLMVLKIQVTEVDEAADFTKTAEEDKDLMEGMDYVCKNEEEFKRRVKELIKHFCDNNLI